MIEVLMEMEGKTGVADATIPNEKGFNPLHTAAIKGNASATRIILSRVTQVSSSSSKESRRKFFVPHQSPYYLGKKYTST